MRTLSAITLCAVWLATAGACDKQDSSKQGDKDKAGAKSAATSTATAKAAAPKGAGVKLELASTEKFGGVSLSVPKGAKCKDTDDAFICPLDNDLGSFFTTVRKAKESELTVDSMVEFFSDADKVDIKKKLSETAVLVAGTMSDERYTVFHTTAVADDLVLNVRCDGPPKAKDALIASCKSFKRN